MDYPEGMQVFKALADETRLRIVEILSCDELCACDILDSFDFTQPTLSYHMKILVESGLVAARKDGSWMRYRLDADKIAKVAAYWTNITSGGESCICHDALAAKNSTQKDGNSTCVLQSSAAKSTTIKEGNPTCVS